MFNLQTWDWIVIFLIALLIFGGKRIPEIARGLGKGIREFKKAKDGIEESIEEEINNKEDENTTPKKQDEQQ